jgi:ribosomal protein L29
MESGARKPNQRKTQTIPKLRVQTKRELCEKRGSLKRELTKGRFWSKAQGGMFQLQ